MRATFAGVALLLAACSTDGAPEEPKLIESHSVTEIDPIREFLETLPPDSDPRAQTAAAAQVGGPVGKLEELTGPAALVRQEGENEFRRYDLGACRAYAVIIPAGGSVASIATGPAEAGKPTPSFDTCLEARARAMVGS